MGVVMKIPDEAMSRAARELTTDLDAETLLDFATRYGVLLTSEQKARARAEYGAPVLPAASRL